MISTRVGPFAVQTCQIRYWSLARVIGDNKDVNDWLRRRLRPAEWVAVSFAPVLKGLAELRNPVAHRERFSREQMVPLRDRLVGVGCMGQLAELGMVRLV